MNGRLIASFLTDEEQTRYEQMLLPLDLDEKARRSLYINQNGSNLWKVLLLNQNGIRTPSLQELDLIARNSPDFLKGCIVDAPAIVLRSNACSDKDRSYFAKQVSGLIGRTSFPHAVVVEGLNVKVDKSSAYSLSFCVSDKLINIFGFHISIVFSDFLIAPEPEQGASNNILSNFISLKK